MSDRILSAVREVEPKKVFQITKEVLSQIIAHEGEVFGASAAECGHYENLDLGDRKGRVQNLSCCFGKTD